MDKKQIMNYLVWGILSTLVSWISYMILFAVTGKVSLSNILSWILTILFCFFTNKKWVFTETEWKLDVLVPEFLRFLMARLFTGVIELVGVPLLVRLGIDRDILGVEGLLPKIWITVVVVALNYIFSKCFIFRKKTNRKDFEN